MHHFIYFTTILMYRNINVVGCIIIWYIDQLYHQEIYCMYICHLLLILARNFAFRIVYFIIGSFDLLLCAIALCFSYNFLFILVAVFAIFCNFLDSVCGQVGLKYQVNNKLNEKLLFLRHKASVILLKYVSYVTIYFNGFANTLA